MEGMLTIVETLSSATADGAADARLVQLYAMLDEHQSFQLKSSAELADIAAYISRLLNDAATRPAGLLLLHQFLPQCPLDLIEARGAHWTELAIRALATRTLNAAQLQLAARCVGHLLHKAPHVPELSKALSNTLLAKLHDALLSLPPAAHSAGLALLAQAQRLHPGAAAIARHQTLAWILSFADSADAALVRQSARCLLLHQQMRGGGSAGAAHADNWTALQWALLAQLHQLLDALYAQTAEVLDEFVAPAGVADAATTLPLAELRLDDDPVRRHVALCQRFCNVAEYLRCALREPFPVAKRVLPARLLAVVSRGLAVNCAGLAAQLITDTIVVGALVPRIHCALFAVLDALVEVLRTNCLPYGGDIVQLVVQSLQWTASGRAAGAKRPFAAIRLAALRVLERWVRTAGAAAGVERVAAQLVPQLVQDTTPFAQEVRLKVLSGARRHMSKKARRALHRAQNDATNLAQQHTRASDPQHTKQVLCDAGNWRLAEAALRALAAVLEAGGQWLEAAQHRLLQEHAVGLACAVVLQPAEATAPAEGGALYASAGCRRALYGLLQALCVGAHPLVPAPVEQARWVWAAAAARDASAAVRAECAAMGAQLERVLHPGGKETMRFRVDEARQRDALKELRRLGGGRRGAEERVESDSGSEEEAEEEDELEAVPEAKPAVAEQVAVEEPIVEEPEIVEAAATNEGSDVEEAEEATEDDQAETDVTTDAPEEENIAPRGRRAARNGNDRDDEVQGSKRARISEPSAPSKVAPVAPVLSVAQMAENAAAEAMADDLMADFVCE